MYITSLTPPPPPYLLACEGVRYYQFWRLEKNLALSLICDYENNHLPQKEFLKEENNYFGTLA
jgi:hypothetical protein